MAIKFLKAEAVPQEGFSIDFPSWLPFAAPSYHLSSNPADYSMYTVPLHLSDIPNRNGYAMPLSELLAWNTNHGRQAYKTWKGKPMFLEHKSDDVTKALGVIADVALRPVTGYGNNKFYKVLALAALDRTKYPDLIQKIDAGEYNTYSMGAMVETWTCSYCGASEGQCNHIDKNKQVVFYELNGRMVYRNTHGIVGYELSSVADPACPASVSDVKITVKPGAR
jgi:hypothetical protein